MTSYVVINNSEIDPLSPLTAELATKWRDNPIAISEAVSNAPVNQSVWHPWDKVTNGDTNIGRIYNSAVDGAVTSAQSGTFASGFEYRFRYNLIMSSSDAIKFQAWDGGAWVDIFQTSASTSHQGVFEMGYGLRTLINHRLSSGTAEVYAEHSNGAAAFPYSIIRILRNTGGITFTGKVWLDKRRGYVIV